jgi:predicted TIM-barrel fold metal-dependent hydrolase
MLSDHHFDPLYARARALDMPICIHTGMSNRIIFDVLFQDLFAGTRFPVLAAFHDLLVNGVPARFPGLRFGFIEAGAFWVPYIISEVKRRAKFLGLNGLPVDEREIIPLSRTYVACRIQDDLNYIMQWTGKKNLVTGSDFGHHDTSTELFAFRDLPQSGKFDQESVDGVVGRNAQVLYGIASPPSRDGHP